MPRALVTGITGQNGHYLAELLGAEGYEIFGLVRERARGEELMRRCPGVEAITGDLTDLASLVAAVERAQPDEVHNLGAVSPVALSFQEPELVAEVTGLGVLRMLEAIRIVGGRDGNPVRFVQASSGEMLGGAGRPSLDETTPLHPRSPYAAAKAFGHHLTVVYREVHGLFACSGILFNHESPRRDERFVTRRITRAAARIKLGLQEELTLGNLEARRDWGFAGDYVQAMWLMLQHREPGDYVVATGQTHSVREFAELAFRLAGVDDWEERVRVEPRLYRPAEPDGRPGDASKARHELGWQPTVGFDELVRMMVDADLKAEQDRL